MKKRKLRHDIDLDGLLKDFVGTPQGGQFREAIKTCDCLTTAEAERYFLGEFQEDVSRRLRAHLLGCPTCARLVARYLHPSSNLLLCYVMNAIPPGSVGNRLRKEIAEHIQTCDECLDQTVLEICQWSEVQRAIVEISWVQHFFNWDTIKTP